MALLPEDSPRALVEADLEPLSERPSPSPAPPLLRVVPAAPPAPWDLDAETFPLLAQLGRNLTALAHQGRLDPVVGRAREMDEVLDVLSMTHPG